MAPLYNVEVLYQRRLARLIVFMAQKKKKKKEVALKEQVFPEQVLASVFMLFFFMSLPRLSTQIIKCHPRILINR